MEHTPGRKYARRQSHRTHVPLVAANLLCVPGGANPSKGPPVQSDGVIPREVRAAAVLSAESAQAGGRHGYHPGLTAPRTNRPQSRGTEIAIVAGSEVLLVVSVVVGSRRGAGGESLRGGRDPITASSSRCRPSAHPQQRLRRCNRLYHANSDRPPQRAAFHSPDCPGPGRALAGSSVAAGRTAGVGCAASAQKATVATSAARAGGPIDVRCMNIPS